MCHNVLGNLHLSEQKITPTQMSTAYHCTQVMVLADRQKKSPPGKEGRLEVRGQEHLSR